MLYKVLKNVSGLVMVTPAFQNKNNSTLIRTGWARAPFGPGRSAAHSTPAEKRTAETQQGGFPEEA